MSGHEQRLRDALRNAPSAPDAPGFGARLSDRARRRRGVHRAGATAGLAVLCVAVVAGALALDPRGSTSPSIAGPTSGETQPSVEPSPSENLDCSRPPDAPADGSPVVPTGAVSARLCGGLVDNGGFNMVWPADTLRGELVDRLVDRLNRLEPYVEPDACTLVLSPPFDLVLEYPDGSKVWVQGDTSGTCANLAVQGGKVWAGADTVLRSTLALVEDQRAKPAPTTPIEPAQCPEKWNGVSYTADADAVVPGSPVGVTACRYLLDPPAPGTITQSADGVLATQAPVEDPSAVLRKIAEGSRSDPCGGIAYDLNRTQDVLLVRDAYGDLQVVSTTPCWANELTGAHRYPSQDLASAVAHLLG